MYLKNNSRYVYPNGKICHPYLGAWKADSSLVYKNYSFIFVNGNPNEDEIQEKWIVLLSQYYKVRGDSQNNEKNELIFRMQELRLRAAIITMLLNSVGMIYSPTLIQTLRDFDEAFSEFQFTEDTINDDLQLIVNMEKMNEVEYRSLKEELESMEKVSGVTGINPEQVFYDWVASYNEAFKTSLCVENISTFTYANNCKRLDEDCSKIEMYQSQN